MVCAKSLDSQPKRVFGRKLGRPLNKSRQEAIDNLLPSLCVPEDIITERANITPDQLFSPAPAGCWLEIGFGQGEHLIGLLERDDNICYIGAEPFINGMSAFLKSLSQHKPECLPRESGDLARQQKDSRLRGKNIMDKVRVHMDDAMMLVRSMADNTLDGIYVLNPDPWPKKRHHKRRMISQDNLKEFHRALKPGGELVMATDVDDLAEWMVTQSISSGLFEWTAQTSSDWKTRPQDWITTKYEEKGANHSSKRQSYLLFRSEASSFS